MNTTHEVTTRTAPDGRKVGYTYRGVIINGWDGRSTQFAMRVDQYGRTRTERSKRTSIARMSTDPYWRIIGDQQKF
jgi:hypothetical protein